MLDPALAAQLATHLANIEPPSSWSPRWTTAPSPPSCRSCWTRSPRCPTSSPSVRADDDAAAARPSRSPASARTSAVRFAGVPMGHEFTSLVLALLQVGGHPVRRSIRGTAAQIRALARRARTSRPTSRCRARTARTWSRPSTLISILNPRITPRRHRRARCFQDEVDDRKVLAVPTVFLDGELFGSGRMRLEEILAKLDTGSQFPRGRAPRRRCEPFDVSWSAAGRRRDGRALRRPQGHPHRPGRPSGSAGRSSTRWRSRTSRRSRTPTARHSRRRWSTT